MGSARHVVCSDCGGFRDETRYADSESSPCPHCGSVRRTIHLVIEDSLKIMDAMQGQVKDTGRPRKKRIRKEFFTGFEQHRKTAKWYMKERLIDRDNDIYREIVIDPESDEVVHQCVEPLGQHRGHGSAKRNAGPRP